MGFSYNVKFLLTGAYVLCCLFRSEPVTAEHSDVNILRFVYVY